MRPTTRRSSMRTAITTPCSRWKWKSKTVKTFNRLWMRSYSAITTRSARETRSRDSTWMTHAAESSDSFKSDSNSWMPMVLVLRTISMLRLRSLTKKSSCRQVSSGKTRQERCKMRKRWARLRSSSNWKKQSTTKSRRQLWLCGKLVKFSATILSRLRNRRRTKELKSSCF